MEEINMSFGETLSKLRKSKGLSQEQLAEELSLTRQTISKWELEQSSPDFSYICKLSNYFNVSTDYLIKGINEKTAPVEKCKINLKTKEKFNNYKFIIGVILLSISLISIITLVIISTFQQWGAIIGKYDFDGFIAFLINTKILWLFYILIILLIIGLMLIIKSRLK